MKKLFTTLCVFAGLMLTACGGANNESKPAGGGTDSYQFWGKLEEGGSFASFTDAAFLLNLDVQGKTTLDKYAFASYDDSPAASNRSYTASYMSGTWKAVQKEGVDCLQIKLAFIEDDGSETDPATYYAYESDGVYSVDLTVSLVKGQSFTRTVKMEGQKGQKYANADAFIQAYKKEFVEPESVVKVESKANGGVAYFQQDGKLLVYVGKDNVANGTYVKTATSLSIKLDNKDVEVTLSQTAATFTYDYDLAGYTSLELVFEMPIADFNKLPVIDENVVVELKDEANGATLTFNKDKSYKINMNFGGSGAYDVQTGAWSYDSATYKVTLTPSSGDAYSSTVEGGKFIIETHISWGNGAVNRDLHFEDSQTVIGKFIAA